MGENKIINNFKEYSSWLSTLKDMEEEFWTTPISEGKWTVAEIISHIMNWDKYLLSKILPLVREGKGMEFPDFDIYNKIASDYAKSGISPIKLLEEAKDKRELLVKELSVMPADKLNEHLTANGVSHCPHTGMSYSLLYIIKEFVDHDNHHKRQITQFLNENNVRRF
ncbi:hypothetical protein CON65_11070 [Bacillus pseudomycoides]|uniref:DinB-like domain-containing protein n=1 Tax=Bacillus pseudomycoides TaxID=64104 RepID=A0AA91VCW1_9BACI|nr:MULTISPECIES: DinB family protein [Bacillus]PEB51395.1 hypothetical protein COO03_16780 [Bacillus sp. AFS098217]PED82641.1 hypothetical protein CON65_11070 [Bacillus pseudomycoides]PEU12069.1 hypothetical protein CN525_21300 [Bacillus sp. AFS014408]PEU17747.1 hypothetical protein CN524_01615 [Bacillus sp. AFS019443]PFW60877.1 hypothetical protein COL20_19880 [Bacillus sp. AFS075034]